MSTLYHLWNETKQDYVVGNYDSTDAQDFVEEVIAQQEKYPNDMLVITKSKDYIEL
jgi:hypothetical protein